MPVIRIESLSKRYRLGVIGRTALHEDLARWWARLHGRPDPTLRIDQLERLKASQSAPTPSSSTSSPNHVWALRDVSFEVKQGEVLGIIGRNGAGKSTLLKILSRVTAPTLGCVKVKGRIASLLEVGTGFNPEMTGRENIFLNGAILGMTRAEVRRKFDDIVTFSGVETYIDTPVKRYSSGMYVRLAFAVAAHLDPEILIVDEVLAVGDAEFQRKCLGKMQDVAGQGRTVLFVSHNMGSIRALCHQALVLDAGMVIGRGDVADMIDLYMARHGTGGEERRHIAPSSPADALGVITEARVYPAEGGMADRISSATPLTVEVAYEIRQSMRGVCVEVKLTKLSQTVLKTWDVDLDEPLLGVRNPGRYRARVTIPGNLLSQGEYHLLPSIGRSRVGAFHVPEEPLSFTVALDAPDNGHKGYLRRDSLLALPLAWETRPSPETGTMT